MENYDDEEYRDGEFEYGVTSALIEDIIEEKKYRGYIYLESDDYDNNFAATVIHDEDSEELFDEIRYNVLVNLISDILKDKEGDDRNASISEIYDLVYAGIHLEEVDDAFDDFDDGKYE